VAFQRTEHRGLKRGLLLPGGPRKLAALGMIRWLAAEAVVSHLLAERVPRADFSGRWRKRKGFAAVELASGEVRLAEVHWYEASGVGQREFKIKRFVD
jgi:hypothetical protein